MDVKGGTLLKSTDAGVAEIITIVEETAVRKYDNDGTKIRINNLPNIDVRRRPPAGGFWVRMWG